MKPAAPPEVPRERPFDEEYQAIARLINEADDFPRLRDHAEHAADAVAMTAHADCISCGDEQPRAECPKSPRPCGKEFGEEASATAEPSTGEP